MQGLTDFIKTLGATRIAAMVAVSITLVGFFGFLIMRATAPQMTPLFTDLSVEDSNAIIKDLERQGIGRRFAKPDDTAKLKEAKPRARRRKS